MLAFMRDLRQRDAGGGIDHGQLEIANTNHFNRAIGPFRVFVQCLFLRYEGALVVLCSTTYLLRSYE